MIHDLAAIFILQVAIVRLTFPRFVAWHARKISIYILGHSITSSLNYHTDSYHNNI
jgi:hypothetical protein